MTATEVSPSTYILRLFRGEEVIETLKIFCVEKGVKAAWINALGSIEKVTLAHYRVDTKKYSEKNLDGIYELVSGIGNVAVFENKPLIHFHVSLSDEAMQGLGGHLVKGYVSATVEIQISVFPTQLTKKFDEEIGLKLFELEEKMV